MTAIPAFVFDLGGVLVDWDPRHLYRKLFADCEAMERFLREVCSPDWNGRQDAGRSFAEGTRELVGRFPREEQLIRAFFDRWDEMIGGSIPGTVSILERLRSQGRELYALSNWSAETFPRVRGRFPFLNWFSQIVISGEVGARKPDVRIYQEFLRRVGRPAADCLFIDDQPDNLAAARKMGFQTVLFDSAVGLEEELRRRGFLDGSPLADSADGS